MVRWRTVVWPLCRAELPPCAWPRRAIGTGASQPPQSVRAPYEVEQLLVRPCEGVVVVAWPNRLPKKVGPFERNRSLLQNILDLNEGADQNVVPPRLKRAG